MEVLLLGGKGDESHSGSDKRKEINLLPFSPDLK